MIVQRTTSPLLFWGEYLRIRDRLTTVRTTSTLFFSTKVKVGPQTFTLRSMARRIKDAGDLWADLPRSKRSIAPAIERLHRLRV